MTAVPHERLGPQGDALILELRRLQWALAREFEETQEQAPPRPSARARPQIGPQARPATDPSEHPDAQPATIETAALVEHARAQLRPALVTAQLHLRAA